MIDRAHEPISPAAWISMSRRSDAGVTPSDETTCDHGTQQRQAGPAGRRKGNNRHLVDADPDAIGAVVVLVGAGGAVEREAVGNAEKEPGRSDRSDELLNRIRIRKAVADEKDLAERRRERSEVARGRGAEVQGGVSAPCVPL